jgi:hypothetical protein
VKETKAEKDARTVGFVVRDWAGDYWYRTNENSDGVTAYAKRPRPKPECRSDALETLRLSRVVLRRLNFSYGCNLIRVLRKRAVPAPDPARPVVLAMTVKEANETLTALERAPKGPSPLDGVFARLEDILDAISVDLPASEWTKDELGDILAALTFHEWVGEQKKSVGRLSALIEKALEA